MGGFVNSTVSRIPNQLRVLIAIGVAVLPKAASAELTVKWDCYLPNASVDCAVVLSGLRSKIPFLTIVDESGGADVAVTLTSIPVANSRRFVCDFVGKTVDGSRTEVHTSDKIPNSIDASTATERILTKLERGLDDFMDQKVAAAVEDGVLTIRVVDPVQLPFSGRHEQTGIRWYVGPAVGIYFSDVQGVGINASGNASLSFNYSERNWRAQQSIGANYSQQSQPVPGTNETASIRFAGGSASNVLAWSLTPDKRWSLGMLVSAEKNPQANYKMRANASAGLEFDFIPRQTVNQQNFGFRCAIGPEFQHYDATNVQGRHQQVISSQFCEIFLSWHFVPVDLWASVGEAVVLQDLEYRSLSAGLSATWRVTDDLTVSPWVSLRQVNRAINEAESTDVSYSNPREVVTASMLATVQQGYTAPFGIQSGVSVRYLFGNGALSSDDQRWKNARNLR